jgi:hypothetical protein
VIVAITRLSGGLTPGDGADPRTFPAIWNATADDIEAAEANITTLQGDVSTLEGDVTNLENVKIELDATLTPPVSPNEGDLWLDSSDGSLYVWYVDVDGGQWIQVRAAAPVPSLPTGGSAGQVLVKDSATDFDASWVYGMPNFLPDPVPDRYFSQPITAFRDDTGQARSLNQMIYAPTLVGKPITVDRIAINVSVAEAGATPRLGIYARSSDNRPGDLILDCGTVDASTTGVKEITISATIPAGLFFVAVAHQGASSTLRLTNCNLDGNIIKAHHTNPVVVLTSYPNSYFESDVSGALPATYGGPSQASERRHPIVALRTATVL